MVLSLSFLGAKAQSDLPKGYTKGCIELADGSQLNRVQVNDTKYLCINGDFFKELKQGRGQEFKELLGK